MLTIDIPGCAPLTMEHLVLDFNGTLALDGVLLDGVAALLHPLAQHLRIHVVTGDTFGQARAQLLGLPCELTVLPAADQERAKHDYVRRLGSHSVACIGNGRNDRMMLEAAALGIAVIQAEGAYAQTIAAADIVVRDVRDALALLLNPLRLAATLRV